MGSSVFDLDAALAAQSKPAGSVFDLDAALAAQNAPQPPERSNMDILGSSITGLGKSAANTAIGGLNQLLGFRGAVPPEPEVLAPWPVAPEEQTAYTVGNVGQFFLPGGIAAKLPKVASNAPKIARLGGLLAKAGTEGATSAALAGAQGQSAGDVTQAGVLGAVVPGIAGAKGALKTAAGNKLAPRIINSLVKPVNKQFEFGANAGRGVAREGITANSLEQLGEKVAAKSDELGDLVDDILKPIKTKIDVLPAFKPVDDAIQQAIKDGDQALLTRYRQFKDQLLYTFAETKPGSGKLAKSAPKATSLTPFEANAMKREIGRQTKWREGDTYADDVNKLGVKVWHGISEMIEKEAPRVKHMNSRWADIISASKAIERRAINEARRDLTGLYPWLSAIGGAGYSTASGDSSVESVAKGLASGVVAKGLGSTAFKTRAAAALGSPAAENAPLLEIIRAILLGTNQSPTATPQGQR